jgi:hypothetical protein
MGFVTPSLLFAAGMFAGMMIFIEIGRWRGARSLAKHPQGADHSLGVAEGAVFGLFGLLVAFTFSGAPARLDARKQLVAEETNAIGTAYLRLDLLAPDAQTSLRGQFRDYLDSRIAVYDKLPDVQAARAELARSVLLQTEIWRAAVAATRLPGGHPDASKLLLPALNSMIDISTTRTVATMTHPPKIIFALLFVLALGCSLLAGHAMAGSKRSWLHTLVFTAFSVMVVFVVLEIEYPRMGLFRMSEFGSILVELRESMR